MHKTIVAVVAVGIAILLAAGSLLTSPVFAANDNQEEDLGPDFICLTGRFVSIANEIVEEDKARVQAEEEAAEAARIAAEEAAAEEEWYDSYGGYGDYSYTYDGPEEYWLYSSYHGASQSAIDAGGIVEFYDHYYAAHNYDAGSVFYGFDSGDIVHIDGQDVVIDGAAYFNYNVDYYEDVMDTVGWGSYVFQTCLGAGSDVVVYYGHAF